MKLNELIEAFYMMGPNGIRSRCNDVCAGHTAGYNYARNVKGMTANNVKGKDINSLQKLPSTANPSFNNGYTIAQHYAVNGMNPISPFYWDGRRFVSLKDIIQKVTKSGLPSEFHGPFQTHKKRR